ncbi:Uncharacterised protein [uncultured archaeon]|nr:Uncharacterised protein [uncultured archaeon]
MGMKLPKFKMRPIPKLNHGLGKTVKGNKLEVPSIKKSFGISEIKKTHIDKLKF